MSNQIVRKEENLARCKFCGAEGLKWNWKVADVRDLATWKLMEPDGDYHDCNDEDRRKENERIQREKAETDEATRRYREANGYL